MKINIQTKYTKMSFEMTSENASKLIADAVGYAQEYRRGMDKGLPALDDGAELEETVAVVPPVVEQRVHSRVEHVFGEKSTWERPTSFSPFEERTYRGFLYIKCESCGKETGYNARIPTSDHRCSCGHHTALKDLKPAHVSCKCGGTFTYMTNIRDDGFAMPCLNCGSRVDMVLNARETAFVTFGRPGGVR